MAEVIKEKNNLKQNYCYVNDRKDRKHGEEDTTNAYRSLI